MVPVARTAYQERLNTPENRRRLISLLEWLLSVGVCENCAVGLALAIVHNEATPDERYDWKAEEVARKATIPLAHREACEAMARARWAEAPRR